jgi:hypothetical protein
VQRIDRGVVAAAHESQTLLGIIRETFFYHKSRRKLVSEINALVLNKSVQFWPKKNGLQQSGQDDVE